MKASLFALLLILAFSGTALAEDSTTTHETIKLLLAPFGVGVEYEIGVERTTEKTEHKEPVMTEREFKELMEKNDCNMGDAPIY